MIQLLHLEVFEFESLSLLLFDGLDPLGNLTLSSFDLEILILRNLSPLLAHQR